LRKSRSQKRRQLFIRTENETLSVAGCASAIQIVRTPTGFAEIFSDDFHYFTRAAFLSLFSLHIAMTK
jgi:hypothetical protein